MPLRRTVLPPKIDEPEVVVVPLFLRQQRLEVSFSLLHCLTLCQPPALRQPVDVRVHREGWSPAWLLAACFLVFTMVLMIIHSMPADAGYLIGMTLPSCGCQLALTMTYTRTDGLDTLCCNADTWNSIWCIEAI